MRVGRLPGALGAAAVLGGVASGVGALAGYEAPLRGALDAEAHSMEGTAAGSPAMQEFPPYDGRFHFVRIAYASGRGGGFGGFGRRRGGQMWAHDYPRAESNFLAILGETTLVGGSGGSWNVFQLGDPEMFKHPIAYIVEVGYWNPSEEEVEALGEYLRKGGFLIVDDFRGPRELRNLEFHLNRALPEATMMTVEPSDEIFDSFFRLVPDDIVPPYGGYAPLWYGIYEDNDPSKRLMVMINANNDMAEYWEFSDMGYYPIDLSNEAYKLGVNYVIYAMTH